MIRVKAPGFIIVRYATLEPYGVAAGDLDPVVAVAEMNKAGIAYPEILSVTFWRKPDWLIAGLAVLTLVPIGLGLSSIAFADSFGGRSMVFLLFGLAFLGFAAALVHRGLVIKKHLVRVTAVYRTIEIRFDRGDRNAFRTELLRRAGLPPAEMP